MILHKKHPTCVRSEKNREHSAALDMIFTGFAYTFDYQQANNLALPRARKKDGVNAQSEKCSQPCDHYDIGIPSKG